MATLWTKSCSVRRVPEATIFRPVSRLTDTLHPASLAAERMSAVARELRSANVSVTFWVIGLADSATTESGRIQEWTWLGRNARSV